VFFGGARRGGVCSQKESEKESKLRVERLANHRVGGGGPDTEHRKGKCTRERQGARKKLQRKKKEASGRTKTEK